MIIWSSICEKHNSLTKSYKGYREIRGKEMKEGTWCVFMLKDHLGISTKDIYILRKSIKRTGAKKAFMDTNVIPYSKNMKAWLNKISSKVAYIYPYKIGFI